MNYCPQKISFSLKYFQKTQTIQKEEMQSKRGSYLDSSGLIWVMIGITSRKAKSNHNILPKMRGSYWQKEWRFQLRRLLTRYTNQTKSLSKLLVSQVKNLSIEWKKFMNSKRPLVATWMGNRTSFKSSLSMDLSLQEKSYLRHVMK